MQHASLKFIILPSVWLVVNAAVTRNESRCSPARRGPSVSNPAHDRARPSCRSRPPSGSSPPRPTGASCMTTGGCRDIVVTEAHKAMTFRHHLLTDALAIARLQTRMRSVHSFHTHECTDLSSALWLSWLWPLQEEFDCRASRRVSLPRKACQRRWSCARLGVEVAKTAGMMPEHIPSCRSRHAEQRGATTSIGRCRCRAEARDGLSFLVREWTYPKM